jgi:hypothetical protein
MWHNVVNTGDGDLKLYSLYAPPEHPDGTVDHTRRTRWPPSTIDPPAIGLPGGPDW